MRYPSKSLLVAVVYLRC